MHRRYPRSASCFRPALDERPINYRSALIGRLIKSVTPREPGHARFVMFARIFVRSARPDFANRDDNIGQMFPRHGVFDVWVGWSIRADTLPRVPSFPRAREAHRANLSRGFMLINPFAHVRCGARNEQRYFVSCSRNAKGSVSVFFFPLSLYHALA